MAIELMQKSFAVLEALGNSEMPRSLKELTAETRLPKPTLYRILQSLVELGYADQDEASGAYTLTNKLIHISRRVNVKWRALPIMEALQQRFNESIHLGVLFGLSIKYVEVVESTRALKVLATLHSTDPFYTTALGRSLVAHLPDDERKAILARLEAHLTVRSGSIAGSWFDDINNALDATRDRGYGLDREETDAGVVCFAVPLFHEGRAVAGISLSMPTARLTPALEQEIVGALMRIRSQEQV